MFKNTKEAIYYSYPKRHPPPFPTAVGYFIFETMYIDVLTLVWCFVAEFNYIIPSILVRWQKELSQHHDSYWFHKLTERFQAQNICN